MLTHTHIHAYYTLMKMEKGKKENNNINLEGKTLITFIINLLHLETEPWAEMYVSDRVLA